jgi:hypothetical protein
MTDTTGDKQGPIGIPLAIQLEVRPALSGQGTINYPESVRDSAHSINTITDETGVIPRPAIHFKNNTNVGAGRGMYEYHGALLLAEGNMLYGGGVPLGTTDIDNGPIGMCGSAGVYGVLLTSPVGGYFWDNSILTTITDATFLAIVQRQTSCAYLDGTFYVCGKYGDIWGSKYLNSAIDWDPLNRINAWAEPSDLLGIVTHREYLLGLKEQSTAVFYDAGTQTGSPLGALMNLNLPWGCANFATVQEVNRDHIWVANHEKYGLQVVRVSNLQAKPISTPAVDRYLQRNQFQITQAQSWSGRAFGHWLYGINFLSSVTGRWVSLVCDLNTGIWNFWSNSIGEGYGFRAGASIKFPTDRQVYLQTANSGYYYLDEIGYKDSDAVAAQYDIRVELTTVMVDGGTSVEKTGNRLEVLADYQSNGKIYVCWSDDDYLTWSPWREMAMGGANCYLDDLGNFRRRAFKFRHESNSPFRIKSAVLFVMAGLS